MNMKEITDKAVAHVIDALTGKTGEEWNGGSATYEGICGWCGPMAPLNRAAFVSKFGEPFTVAVEGMARAKIAERAGWWNASKARGYEERATENQKADASSFKVGDFVWGIMDGCKCDHEDLTLVFRGFIEAEAETKEEYKPGKPRLCRIIRIEDVEDIERDAATLLKGWETKYSLVHSRDLVVENESEGGSASDDLTDEQMSWSNYSNLTDEQKRTIYTLAVLIRDRKGKWIMVDPEGYNYPRYVILPTFWRANFPLIVAEVTAKQEAERIAAEEAKAAADAKARAEYEARCAKWASMMEAVPAGLSEYETEYRKIGKRNVLKMARAAFPWVRFSVSARRGWGHGYVLSWTNGPTVDELKAKTDFTLFEPWTDTFDGMTDCAGVSKAAFTDFSDKFGGIGNGVEFCREEAATDRNGSPDDPPKAPKPKAENSAVHADVVTVTANEEKGGIEIRFPAMPSEKIRNLCKGAGFRWSKFSKCWWSKMSDRSVAAAEQIVAEWEKENGQAAA